MKSNNPIWEKSEAYAVDVIKVCKRIAQEHKEYNMSQQLLRCSTSVAANYNEARRSQTNADFIAKLSICLKEAAESACWLRLLHQTDYIDDYTYDDLSEKANEIERILTAIIRTSKERYSKKKE